MGSKFGSLRHKGFWRGGGSLYFLYKHKIEFFLKKWGGPVTQQSINSIKNLDAADQLLLEVRYLEQPLLLILEKNEKRGIRSSNLIKLSSWIK